MPSATALIPEVGQAVRVRNRLATVWAVEPYDSRDAGRLHLVEAFLLMLKQLIDGDANTGTRFRAHPHLTASSGTPVRAPVHPWS